MKGYILERGGRMAPFGDPVGESWVLDGTLRQQQERALERLGCSSVQGLPWPLAEPLDAAAHGEAALVIDDECYASLGALRTFLAAARPLAEPHAAALTAGRIAQWCSALGGPPLGPEGEARLGLRYLPGGLAGSLALDLDELPLLPLDPGGGELRAPARHGVSEDDLVLPAPARVAFHLRHWTHLLLANLFGFGAAVHDQGKVSNILRILWAALRAFSLNPHAVAGKLNRIGPGCIIHPTAVIEGCTLGSKVHVGAHAVLQGCVVGDGAVIEELCCVAVSVLGPGARIQRLGGARFSVIYPGGEVGGGVQMSVVGRDASIKHSSFAMDMSLGGEPIRCRLPDGSLADSGLPFLGTAFGHRCLVGSGVWIAPGRDLPNDTVVLRPPSDVLLAVPRDLVPGKPSWVHKGRLVQG